jgi:glutamate synthase (NADPH/NADH) large chain
MVELEAMLEEDKAEVKAMIERHFRYTGSDPAEWVLENWDVAAEHFVKVMPKDYKAVLQKKSAAPKLEKVAVK